jgi:hypothetical protein
MTKFQQELEIAIDDWADSYRRNDVSVHQDRQKLESLISRAVDRKSIKSLQDCIDTFWTTEGDE